MALLQISEPGQSPAPHQRRLAIGIDLGTTHSLVAAVQSGVARCLPDAEGRVLLPSVVRYLEDGARHIGHHAAAARTLDARNTIASAKRFMGRSMDDLAHEAPHLPYEFVATPGMVALATAAGVKSPVEISAEILASLRQRAEDSLGGLIDGAVITVPAYFDDAQRQATKDAAQLAGLKVLRLINEPTAAAIAYGLDNAAEGVYAVYDLGGGTFDISILRLTQGVFEVMATGGDSALGGDDYDAALADALCRSHGVVAHSPADKAALRLAARACKEALTDHDSAPFSVALGGTTHQWTVQRSELASASAALTERTLTAVRRTLRDAQLRPHDVQGVVLVGGSTRMPQIVQAVSAFFGRAPFTNLNPDEVVALGAAQQAHQLVGNNPHGDMLLLDVIALSLGLETMGGLVERIIPRNETLPTARAQDFTTYQDGQTAISLHVVQGERDLVQDCRSLARFELRGIPPMAAGAARVRVTFTVDADGLLCVQAQELTSGAQAHIEVKPSYGLSDEQIARMLQDGFASAAHDLHARALAQARVDAERLLLATVSALQADGHLLTAAERAPIDSLLNTLRERLAQGTDPAALDAAAQQLAQGTEAFAAARMNHSIRQALRGQHVQAL